MAPVAHKFQRAALALLICAPSDLRRLWLAKDQNGVTNELTRLGFSPQAMADIQACMTKCRGGILEQAALGDTLRDEIWDGGEPHPDGPGGGSIVAAMRTLDGE